MDTADIAALVRDMRQASGLSQQDFAVRAGMAQSAISNYELGRKVPSLPTLARLAEAAGAALEVGFRRDDSLTYMGHAPRDVAPSSTAPSEPRVVVDPPAAPAAPTVPTPSDLGGFPPPAGDPWPSPIDRLATLVPHVGHSLAPFESAERPLRHITNVVRVVDLHGRFSSLAHEADRLGHADD
ncbi:MAG: helix-turn-helix domain-containing protein [Ilumatobacteraceae bacterium]